MGTFTVSAETTPKDQLNNPSQLHEITVSEGITKIVAASLRDLNAIFTPFDHPVVIKKSKMDFKRHNNVLYFQPKSERPVGIYITENGKESAPIFKLTIVPSDVPVGQQIKMVPVDKEYFLRKQIIQESKTSPDYTSNLIRLLSETAKDGQPANFTKDKSFDTPTFYIGNILLSPSKKLIGANYEIIVLEAQNRNNVPVELSESDFSRLSPDTGLVKKDGNKSVSAVGFYPRIFLQPNATTDVYLLRVRDYE